jgi:hypothetical protein
MVRVEADAPGYRFVVCDDVAIVAWLSPPTVEVAAKLLAFLTGLAEQRQGHIYVFVVINSLRGVPDGRTRQVMAECMTRVAAFTHHMVVTIESTGFLAAMVRSVGSGIRLLARKSPPVKILGDVDSAIDFLMKARGLTGTLDREELTRAVRLAKSGA